LDCFKELFPSSKATVTQSSPGEQHMKRTVPLLLSAGPWKFTWWERTHGAWKHIWLWTSCWQYHPSW